MAAAASLVAVSAAFALGLPGLLAHLHHGGVRVALGAAALGAPLLVWLLGLVARGRTSMRLLRPWLCAYVVAVAGGYVLYKLVFWRSLLEDPFFEGYTTLVLAFFVSRIVLACIVYRPAADAGHEPTVSVVMSVFNEEDVIERAVGALEDLDYPESKLELIVVDDGSRDRTPALLDRMCDANPRLHPIRFTANRGKRAAMAAGIRRSQGEIVVFVDSDSILEPEAVRVIVQDFADPRVGSVCGHADVTNVRGSWLARMQAVRYYSAFRIFKAAESVFGMVSCVSGCFAAYRRAAIEPHVDAWKTQRFLGRSTLVGDDRSLTNVVLRDWRVTYAARARCTTVVPERPRAFVTQQARWKRSWIREGLILSSFVWRKHPAGAAAAYLNFAMAFMAPLMLFRGLLMMPLSGSPVAPVLLGTGLLVASIAYGFVYQLRHRRPDATWAFGTVFVAASVLLLIWQNYYALFTIRNGKWGTRAVPGDADTAYTRREGRRVSMKKNPHARAAPAT